LGAQLKDASPTDRARLVARWLAQDPLREISDTWAEAQRILQPFLNVKDDDSNAFLVDVVARVWSTRDPHATIVFLGAKDPRFLSAGLRSCARLLAARDPEQWLADLMKPATLDPAILGKCAAAAGLTKDSAPAALAPLQAAERAAFLDSYVEGLTPGAQLAAGELFTADILPPQAAITLCDKLLLYGTVDVSQWLGGLNDIEKNKLLDKMYVSSAPDANLRARLKIGSPKPGLVNDVFWLMGSASSQDALDLASLLPPEQREQALAAFQQGFAVANADSPATLIPYLQGLAGDALVRSVATATARWSASDCGPLLSFIDTMEDPKLRAQAYGSFLHYKGRDMPLSEQQRILAEQVRAAPSESNYLKEAIEDVTWQTALEQPRDAAQWIETLPDGANKNQATEMLVDAWARTDSVACAEWVTGLPPGAVKDRVAAKLVEDGVSEPQRALQTLTTISDPRLRSKAGLALADFWKPISPDYLVGLIRSSSLSPDQQVAMEARLGAETNAKGGQ
jgi:hypothetical protein